MNATPAINITKENAFGVFSALMVQIKQATENFICDSCTDAESAIIVAIKKSKNARNIINILSEKGLSVELISKLDDELNELNNFISQIEGKTIITVKITVID